MNRPDTTWFWLALFFLSLSNASCCCSKDNTLDDGWSVYASASRNENENYDFGTRYKSYSDCMKMATINLRPESLYDIPLDRNSIGCGYSGHSLFTTWFNNFIHGFGKHSVYCTVEIVEPIKRENSFTYSPDKVRDCVTPLSPIAEWLGL